MHLASMEPGSSSIATWEESSAVTVHPRDATYTAFVRAVKPAAYCGVACCA